MNELKSIWDGWTDQAFGQWSTSDGRRCALGFLSGPTCFYSNTPQYETRERVASYIKQHYPMPWGFVDEWGNNLYDYDSSIIIYANNTLRLTPEDFRRIDRETQIQAGMEAVRKLVDQPVEVPVDAS